MSSSLRYRCATVVAHPYRPGGNITRCARNAKSARLPKFPSASLKDSLCRAQSNSCSTFRRAGGQRAAQKRTSPRVDEHDDGPRCAAYAGRSFTCRAADRRRDSDVPLARNDRQGGPRDARIRRPRDRRRRRLSRRQRQPRRRPRLARRTPRQRAEPRGRRVDQGRGRSNSAPPTS